MKYCKVMVGVVVALSGLAGYARPVWTDPVEPGANSVEWRLSDGKSLRVDVLAESLFRIRRSWTNVWTESGMNRYGVLRRDWPTAAFTRAGDSLKTSAAELTFDAASGTLRFKSLVSAADLTIAAAAADAGSEVRFSLKPGERVYGLGDVSRDNIQRRGKRYEMWVKNVLSYIPIPMAMTSEGWGFLLNTTWHHFIDVGAKDEDALVCEIPEGDADFYVFTGKGYREMLDTYTQLSGRPALLPAFGFGFTFVCNQFIDQFNLVRDAYEFRKTGIPCDTLGLEPGWMEQFYDFSTRKTWNPRLFTFPHWTKSRAMSWIGGLDRLGFKLSLWLCFNYDLYRYEEQCAVGAAKASGRQMKTAEGIPESWVDQNVVGEVQKADERETNPFVTPGIDRSHGDEVNYREGDQPWFEHLKKFVDRGARCFKLDGSRQVTPHPADQKWANGMSTAEAHNLYPLLYDKEMARGYEDYTGKRSMTYSAGGYAGVQQYVATWAGDTGGGHRELVSCFNLGLSGHPNQSCDMSIWRTANIHFATFSPWMQQNNWDSWQMPWINPPEKVAAIREYVKLRYRLFPYVYAFAAEAARTGWPFVRPLALVYPDRPDYDAVDGTYLFGDSLLVSAFVKETEIPEGVWHDWKTGEAVTGPCRRAVKETADWGGGLYVKAGAIVPTWPDRQHLDRGWNDRVIVETWPSAAGSFELYEDDGDSLDYRKGVCAKTPLELKADAAGATFTVGARTGSFKGMPASRAFTVRFHLDAQPSAVTRDGQPVEGVWCAKSKTFTVEIGDCGVAPHSVSIRF